jgi:hypothetical protein
MIELNEIITHLYFFQKRIEYVLAEFHSLCVQVNYAVYF